MSSYSLSHLKYLKNIKKKQRFILSMQIILAIAFIVLWELLANIGFIDAFIFSCPSRIIKCFINVLKDATIFKHIMITLSETFISFGLIVFIGVSFALIMWMFKTFSDIIEPFLIILNSLPKSALAPMLIVWLGNSPKAIIVTAVSVAIFGTTLNVYTGFLSTDSDKIKLMKTFNSSKFDILTKLILPNSLGTIISNMKVSIGLCLVGVIIGEFLAARAGLGYLIIYSSQVFAMDTISMAIIILCIVSIILFKIVDLIELIYKRLT